jgi:hypothetical protein
MLEGAEPRVLTDHSHSSFGKFLAALGGFSPRSYSLREDHLWPEGLSGVELFSRMSPYFPSPHFQKGGVVHRSGGKREKQGVGNPGNG